MTNQIEQRIKELALEQKVLEDTHNFQVQENQKINQEFQQKVVKNQTRFAQITGGITELRNLLQHKGDNNHDDSIPTLNLGNRLVDVRIGEQPESR